MDTRVVNQCVLLVKVESLNQTLYLAGKVLIVENVENQTKKSFGFCYENTFLRG